MQTNHQKKILNNQTKVKTISTVAYYRNDLQEIYINLPFFDVTYQRLIIAKTGVLVGDDLAIFIDDDGATKILKNRLGRTT